MIINLREKSLLIKITKMSETIASEKIDLDAFTEQLTARHPGETEYHQRVRELMNDVLPFLKKEKKYQGYALAERLTEPDRCISFRVTWTDDQGNIQVNRGYRVQFSDALGPYKGGLRFHPSVDRSLLKSLAFEQVFKNSLTGLPIGGAKGGADFNPKGKTDAEVMRFCQAFMKKLFRYLGPDTDVPAGDIGVGKREIGYLYGVYRELRNADLGVITGKPLSFGGSALRREATGYGVVYFAEEMLGAGNNTLEGKKCLVSGSGNVAQHVAEKLIQLGGKVLSLSDSDGTVYLESGIDVEQLAWIKALKNERQGRMHEFAEAFGAAYLEGQKPWTLAGDIAFPCATENEITKQDASHLLDNGCSMIVEGANMPVTPEALQIIQEAGMSYAPGKAANAGGVAISALEMSQNNRRLSWPEDDIDDKLREIMRRMHNTCLEHGKKNNGVTNYARGANIAGFIRAADAIIAQGVL